MFRFVSSLIRKPSAWIPIAMSLIIILIVGAVGYFAFVKNSGTTAVEYRNNQYGFKFVLPASWQGYSIINDKWEGRPSDEGPMISIRHPKWTTQTPRQDIPIMIFTTSQWDSLQQHKFHIGAAPFEPVDLGRNPKYVFALPARYNYAFPTGYEEVDKILQTNPLQAF